MGFWRNAIVAFSVVALSGAGDAQQRRWHQATPEQKAAAEQSKTAMDNSGRFRRPIVTLIEPAPTFYRAEEYHQRYLEKRGLAHCSI